VLFWVVPIALLGAVQAFLVFREQIFSPVDEIQHVDYVRTIAMEARLPVFGEKQIDLGLISLYFHEYPASPSAAQLDRIGPAGRSSYEALQFPVYYLAAAPLYKLLSADPKTAVYGLRLLNVFLSVLWLVLLIMLLRRIGVGRGVAVGVSLALTLIPGVALRDSQVINEVLTSVLVTGLFYLLVDPHPTRPRLHSAAEGLIFGLAVLTKLTAAALLPVVVLAWLWRDRPRGGRLLAGAAGFLLAWAPWLAWAIPVYGIPVPFVARHPRIFNLANYALPHTLDVWTGYLGRLVRYFWFPWEWQLPPGVWRWLDPAASWTVTLLLAAAVGWATVHALGQRARPSVTRRAVLLASASLASFVVAYALFIIWLNRIWETDFRELYIFFGPLAILLSYMAVRIGQRAVAAVAIALVALWLVTDIGFYLVGSCPRCYP
jgi:4-amino-4-deoxy-L-arabinose transferase-like glycosyltransferase